MYKKSSKCWVGGEYDEYTLKKVRESTSEEPELLFIKADLLLENANEGNNTVEAVYVMEQAAKAGFPRAALAMAQLFEHGWAVHRNKKLCLEWYKKAAELKDPDAIEYMEAYRRSRKKRIILLGTVTTGALAALLILALLIPALLPTKGVKVHKNTDFQENEDLIEVSKEINKLIDAYDDAEVRSGKKRTLRLLVQYEGAGIDLSSFKAVAVISDTEGFLVIQFDDEKEADRCIAALKKMKNVQHVSEDHYSIGLNLAKSPTDLTSTAVPYTSAHTGYEYLSWGVEYMGMDLLASWTMSQPSKSVTVAVLDTGSTPGSLTQDRYLEGIDLIDDSNMNGWGDQNGHGTHVAGTIIDCTQGLDVKVMPIRVLNEYGSGPDSGIAMGIKIAVSAGVNVINMSLGGHATSPCGSSKDFFIEQAVARGITVVVSAGNGDEYGTPIDTATVCPAHLETVIVVAACDSSDNPASFSNYGNSVDVCAPGVQVLSHYPNDLFAVMDGTSMATPHVSALVAMLYAAESTCNYSPEQIERMIKDYCVYMGNEPYYGWGIPYAGHFAGT